MGKAVGSGEESRAELTQVVIVFLLALLGQGSALGICKRPTVSSEGTRCSSPHEPPGLALEPLHPHGVRAAPVLSLPLGPGQTCEFSLLGEVGGAGAAGDTNE